MCETNCSSSVARSESDDFGRKMNFLDATKEKNRYKIRMCFLFMYFLPMYFFFGAITVEG